MSERYSKLFALPENLYAEGAPLLIAAGALLKDNQTDKVLAQLKFHSLSPKVIKAVKVKIIPMDTVSHPLGEAVAYQYLDLNAARCDEFGQKSPIALPDAATRSFSAEVCEVAFADNTLWQAKGELWEVLKKPVSLSTAIPDQELRKQVKLEYGNAFAYIPTTDKDLWICSCGERNHKGEHTCARCHQELNRLLELDMEALKAKCDARLDAEKAQADREAAQAKARAKRNKKLAVVITPIVVVAIVAAVFVYGMAQKNNDYSKAQELFAAGKYDEAISAFEALGDYKDSEQQIENAQVRILENAYDAARELLDSGEFDSAIEAFSKLGNYKDSAEQIEKIQNQKLENTYQEVLLMIESRDYQDALEGLHGLEDYKDCAQMAQQLHAELEAYDTIINNYKKGNFEAVREAIAANQYVTLDEWKTQAMDFIEPFIGKWTYKSGDAGILSMREGRRGITYFESRDIEITYKYHIDAGISVHYKAPKNTPQSYSTNHSWECSLYDINTQERALALKEQCDGGFIEAKITEDDTLLISLEGYSLFGSDGKLVPGQITTCEYKRA